LNSDSARSRASQHDVFQIWNPHCRLNRAEAALLAALRTALHTAIEKRPLSERTYS
jgi:nicotinamidase-related amidase